MHIRTPCKTLLKRLKHHAWSIPDSDWQIVPEYDHVRAIWTYVLYSPEHEVLSVYHRTAETWVSERTLETVVLSDINELINDIETLLTTRAYRTFDFMG